MSQPIRVLVWILGVLVLLTLVAAALMQPLSAAFGATPVFNGVIVAVFVVGLAVNLAQVLRLQREVKWIESLRRSGPDRAAQGTPVLLAPMAKMFGKNERKPQSFSTASTRTILDSVYLRLEEQRDLSRYLIGLLIFLGLLGTFWGLLITIGSVSEIIGGLSGGIDAAAMFETLKTSLQRPLSGMATSFSTSLFGLAGSLVLGLTDLLTGRAANRFYNELEEWLSGMTRLSAGGIGSGEGDTSVPAYVQALLEQTADGLERMQRAIVESERERRGANEQMAELSTHLARLAETQTELRSALKALGQNNGLNEDLRAEFRLLGRTIAAASEPRRGGA
jgi:hypothetical protein